MSLFDKLRDWFTGKSVKTIPVNVSSIVTTIPHSSVDTGVLINPKQIEKALKEDNKWFEDQQKEKVEHKLNPTKAEAIKRKRGRKKKGESRG